MSKYTPLGLIFGDILTQARAATLETQYKYAKERTWPLGGIADSGVTDTSYVDVPGAVIADLIENMAAKVHVMGFVSGGTGSIRLWDITGGAMVSSSEITFTNTSAGLQKTPELALLAGRQYKLQVKISSTAFYCVAYGAHLVSQ